MPVYQYTCTECGEALEVRQAFTDDALTVCPVCAGRLRKVLSAVGVVFKGSGFYRNDSRPKESTGEGSDGAAAAKTEPAKAGASTDGSTANSSSSKAETTNSTPSSSAGGSETKSGSSGSKSGSSSSSSGSGPSSSAPSKAAS